MQTIRIMTDKELIARVCSAIVQYEHISGNRVSPEEIVDMVDMALTIPKSYAYENLWIYTINRDWHEG